MAQELDQEGAATIGAAAAGRARLGASSEIPKGTPDRAPSEPRGTAVAAKHAGVQVNLYRGMGGGPARPPLQIAVRASSRDEGYAKR